jgi:tRNA(Arg) A34 adenosine deaminase TadA
VPIVLPMRRCCGVPLPLAPGRLGWGPPYASLLARPDGRVPAEVHNAVRRDDDITAHPELKLARCAARGLDADTAARSTLCTSCRPWGMCDGGIVRSGIGRVVSALSTEQLVALNPFLRRGRPCPRRRASGSLPFPEVWCGGGRVPA